MHRDLGLWVDSQPGRPGGPSLVVDNLVEDFVARSINENALGNLKSGHGFAPRRDVVAVAKTSGPGEG